jgi:hypothetical protein
MATLKIWNGASWDTITYSTDHGALTGLEDDDHTQYHNDTRGDARYPLLSDQEYLASGKAIGGGDTLVYPSILSGNILQVKSLVGGGGISLSPSAAEIDISTDDSAIDHDGLLNFVTNEHLDWTASVGTIHADNYTDSNTTDHTALSNIGLKSHTLIDSHINTLSSHRTILDSGTSTTDLWSADKIESELTNRIYAKYWSGGKGSGTQAVATLADATFDKEDETSGTGHFLLTGDSLLIYNPGAYLVNASLSVIKSSANANCRIQFLVAHDKGAGFTYPARAFTSSHARVNGTSTAIPLTYLAVCTGNSEEIKFQHRDTLSAGNIDVESAGLQVTVVQVG